jgi:mono/diheme cytochrome c family protein
MTIYSRLPSVFFICCFFLIPGLLQAQEGNHCAVKKSPFRISMETGNKIFTSQCQSCHHADSLKSTSSIQDLGGKMVSGDKMKLIVFMMKGQITPEEKNGKNNQKTMPVYPDMKDQDMADVLTYIRNSFGNKESAVKASEVQSARSRLN